MTSFGNWYLAILNNEQYSVRGTDFAIAGQPKLNVQVIVPIVDPLTPSYRGFDLFTVDFEQGWINSIYFF